MYVFIVHDFRLLNAMFIMPEMHLCKRSKVNENESSHRIQLMPPVRHSSRAKCIQRVWHIVYMKVDIYGHEKTFYDDEN